MYFVIWFAGVAAIVLEQRRRVAALVDRTLQEAGLSHKAAALALGRDFGHFSRLHQNGTMQVADLLVLNELTEGRLIDRLSELGGVVTLRFWLHHTLTAARNQLQAECRADSARGKDVA